MTSHTLKQYSAYIALAACTFFFLTGQVFLPLLGIQDDEALFAGPLYDPRTALYSYHLGHSQIPLMLMSYLGALKTLIYFAIFRAFGTGIWPLREPALVMGAASVWLFFLLLRRSVGKRAALIGCVLLAVDSIYLLTSCFDWGPVALQHLLLAGGFLLLVQFYQTRRYIRLGAGFFLLGLAMWDKALAIWMLSGVGLATILTFPRQIFGVTGFRTASISVLAFVAGALPLVVYNVQNGYTTFRENTVWNIDNVSLRARFLVTAAQGGALPGYLARSNEDTPAPHPPRGAIQTASASISSFAGHPGSNWLLWGFGLALALAPLAGRDNLRAIVFCLIALSVAWFEMAVNNDTGGGVHHTILLWPLPQAIIAISFAGVSRRLGRAALPALAVAVGLLAASNLLVTNEFYSQVVRNGGTVAWSDAIFPLSSYLKSTPSQRVFCMDWGLLDELLLLNRGHLRLQMGVDPVRKPEPELTAEDRKTLTWMVNQPEALYLAHAKEAEFFHGVNENLAAFAAGIGFERQTVAAIPDSYGRTVFEVYRMVPSQPAAAAPARTGSKQR